MSSSAVSVQDALKKGRFSLTIMSVIIMFTCIVGSAAITIFFEFDLAILFGFGFGILFMWLWWSFAVTRWKIWAYENVRNVHELKRKAINQNLIWPDNSFFNKTIIASALQKERLQELEKKFEIEDTIVEVDEDITVRYETELHFSKINKYLLLVFGCVFLGIGVFIIITEGISIVGVVFPASGLFMLKEAFQKIVSTTPQITLNEDGIKTINSEFLKWSEVEDCYIEYLGSGKSRKCYLVTEFRTKTKGIQKNKIQVDELNKNPFKIESLVALYRQRNRKKL